jgi:hypothetical protein
MLVDLGAENDGVEGEVVERGQRGQEDGLKGTSVKGRVIGIQSEYESKFPRQKFEFMIDFAKAINFGK